MKFRILVIDDDPLILDTMKLYLEGHGYEVDTAGDGERALEQVTLSPSAYALVILDYQMKGMDGRAVLRALKQISPELFILIYSGDSSREAVRLTWQAGAVGFLEKAGNESDLLTEVESWCRKFAETRCVVTAAEPGGHSLAASMGMVGRSEALEQIAARVERYKRVNQNVLILGETGTGKELVARALHAGPDVPFLAVNCAVYRGSGDLMESELFGYEKGAFTGASQERRGIFEVADGGTVFLDEVHHLGPTAQAKLLRAIQEKRIRRVGGTREYDVRFRLVCAAKPDLALRAEQGEFLTDLYHRMGVLLISIPPLRERPEDIEPLVAHFCRKFEKETGEKKHFLLRTLPYLENYDWPGNVRELENVVYQILTDSPSDRIAPEHLDAKFFRRREGSSTQSYEELKRRFEKQEKDFVANVLQGAKSKSEAARRLKISPTTLHSVLQRLGLLH